MKILKTELQQLLDKRSKVPYEPVIVKLEDRAYNYSYAINKTLEDRINHIYSIFCIDYTDSGIDEESYTIPKPKNIKRIIYALLTRDIEFSGKLVENIVKDLDLKDHG